MTQEQNKYFGYVRTDVLRHVPTTAKHVLSIGCGFGNTEKLLIDKGIRVTGIEPSPEAAPIAKENGLKIIQKGASEGLQEITGRKFDCILLSDVLEHLVSPQDILIQCCELADSGSTIVISVPNFRHYSVFFNLFVHGIIPEKDAGIFDKTHLQITTMKRTEDWLKKANARTIIKEYKYSRRLEMALSRASFGLLNEFVAPQVILKAIKN